MGKAQAHPFSKQNYDAQWWDEWDARQAARKQGKTVVPFREDSPKNNTIKIVEYDHIGPEPWRGVFIGQREDKQEVAIITQAMTKKKRTTALCNASKKDDLSLPYSAGRAWTSAGMLTVHAVALTHQQTLKVPDKEVKEGEGDPVKLRISLVILFLEKNGNKQHCTCCICAQPITCVMPTK